MFQSKEEKIKNARVQIRQRFRTFLEGEGQLPAGFSQPYHEIVSSHDIRSKTPFEGYLKTIWDQVDLLRDETGISDWLYLEDTADINAAAAAIAAWAGRHREENRKLHEMCRIGSTTIMLPVSPYCTGKVMVVMKDGEACRAMTAGSVEVCRAAGISFCTILSDRKLYDLTGQKEKEIQYVTYPNYHDETYANWYLV